LAEYGFRTLVATVDADGNVLASKVSIETVVRYPVNGQAADVAIALAYHRDITAGDEFGASVNSQNWLS
jgi:hypothetical protein